MHTRATHRLPRAVALLAALAALVLAAATALAGTFQIRDSAALLSPDAAAQLRSSGARYPFDVRVLTSSDYADRAAFDQYVGAQVAGPNMVVVGVDPTHHRTAVHFGTGTRIARSQFTAIESAGNGSFRAGDWRGGIEAILSQAQAAVGTGPALAPPTGSSGYAPYNAPYNAPYGAPYNAPYAPQRTQQHRRGFPGGLLLIALLIGGGVLIASMLRRRRAAMGGGGYGYGPYQQGPNPPFGGQGGGGYGPGYGPGYAPRGGSGLGTGMLGAGLGGLLGYGLGRASADHEHHDDERPLPTPREGGPMGQPGGGWDAGGGTSDWESGGGSGGGGWDAGGGFGGGGGGGGGDAGGGGGSDW